MTGFKNQFLNDNIKFSIVYNIMNKLDNALNYLLKIDEIVENKEDIITAILYEKYIRFNLDIANFYCEIQSQENPINYKYQGRADLKFCNLIDPHKYFIVECKRLDGKNKLNKEYIKNGICRFTFKPKYLSPYSINFMIGYIVADIDTNKIIININEQLKDNENKCSKTKLKLHECRLLTNKFCNNVYFSHHYINNKEEDMNKDIGLIHIFVNLHSIVESKA